MYYYRACLNLYGTPVENDGRSFSDINEESIPKYFNKTINKTENRSGFGNNNYDAEVLIAQLGYHYWLDTSLTRNPNFQSKVELIEDLDDSEYLAFWEVYFGKLPQVEIKKYKFSDLEALNFDYRGKKYYEIVYERCKNYIENKQLNVLNSKYVYFLDQKTVN